MMIGDSERNGLTQHLTEARWTVRQLSDDLSTTFRYFLLLLSWHAHMPQAPRREAMLSIKLRKLLDTLAARVHEFDDLLLERAKLGIGLDGFEQRR